MEFDQGGHSQFLGDVLKLTKLVIVKNFGDQQDGGGGSGLGDVYIPVTGLAATNLSDCAVGFNTASGDGGGLDDSTPSSITVTNSNVENNTAVVVVGIANQGALVVQNGNIQNNTATSAGGGVSTTGGGATITDSRINTNQVINPSGTAAGGGIDCENSTLTLSNDVVNANQADGLNAYGGGIYALSSTVDVENSTINGNQANGSVVGEGGGVYASGGVFALSNTIVKGDKATTVYDDVDIV